jgi:hypothetical protein
MPIAPELLLEVPVNDSVHFLNPISSGYDIIIDRHLSSTAAASAFHCLERNASVCFILLGGSCCL